MGKTFLRYVVSVLYLCLLAFIAGFGGAALLSNFQGDTGDALRWIVLVGVVITYWSTKGAILNKLGLGVPAPVEPAK